jgi:hypothetical protein
LALNHKGGLTTDEHLEALIIPNTDSIRFAFPSASFATFGFKSESKIFAFIGVHSRLKRSVVYMYGSESAIIRVIREEKPYRQMLWTQNQTP